MSSGTRFHAQPPQQSALTRQRNLPYAGMPYFRSTSPPDPHPAMVVKTSRFSILHDVHAQQSVSLSNPGGNEKLNGHAKRSSRLPDIITVGLRRNRTTSLPHRPRSSDGRAARLPSDPVEDSVISVASSSRASVVDGDPFAAHPSSSSFVTYDQPGGNARSRPEMNPSQRVAPPGPVSQVLASSPGSSKRRGSILVAASDALTSLSSSFTRKKRTAGLGAVPQTPIVLSEVIEISSSSNARLREHEDEERERLREVAAQSLGLGPVLLENKLSRLKSGEDVMMVDPERERGLGMHSRLARLSSDDEDETGEDDNDEDDDEERPPESDITGFTSVSVPIPTPLPSPLSPQQTHHPQPPPVHNQSYHPSATSSPAVIPFTLQNRARSGSVVRSHHSHSHSQSHIHYHALNTSQLSRSTTPGVIQSIPAFPASHAMIKPFVKHQAMFPKHYPPPSLLMFALAKQWKARFIVLTSPVSGSPGSSPRPSGSSYSHFTSSSTSNIISASSPTALRPSSGPAVSYLHLFKGPGLEEREIERLEINDDSVVYLSDEDVGGRRNVVKVGGVDVGAMKKELNPEESGRTMWSLQISDPGEAQKWIEGVKGAVLSQRSVRAGLGNVLNSGGVEPRGDLDVMLSMRAQGLLPMPESSASSASLTPRVQSPVIPQQHNFTNPFESNSPVDGRSLSPPSTLSRSHSRSNAASPTPSTRQHNSAVSALKGLFSSNRPRSPSSSSAVPATAAVAQANDPNQDTPHEDSFGALGTNLLMMRSNSVCSEGQFSPTSSVFSGSLNNQAGMGSPTSPSTPRLTTPTLDTAQSQPLAPRMLDRKILPDSDRQQLAELAELSMPSDSHPNGSGRISSLAMKDSESTLRAFGSPSLHPPPRRRAWTSSGTPARPSGESNPPPYPYSHANGSTAESLGVRQLSGNGSISGAMTPTFSSGPSTPGSDNLKVGGHNKKRTSWSSATSSFTSGSGSLGHESSPELVARRKSLRNGNGNMLTPMNGSPAPVPSPLGSSSRPSTTGSRHPYAAETPGSPTSSDLSSPQSLVLDLRPLSPKRTSGSSMHSFSTTTSQSRSPGMFSHRPLSSHRTSMPPPQRPAPLSALPPTPGQYEEAPLSPSSSGRVPQSAPASKSAFQNLLSQRASHRLSLSPPSHPPSSSLPPRPDEPGFKPTHRKSASTSSSIGSPPPLYPIPASPTPLESPYPPPNGPLPPTPTSTTTPNPPVTPPTSSQRHSISLKRRLRILSAPGPSPSRTPTPDAALHIDAEPADSPEPIPPMIPPSFYADPITTQTPIGGPITTLQNDPNFLSMSTPSTPLVTTAPRNLPLRPSDQPPPPEMLASLDDDTESPTAVMTSLSPPPRRGSKRISTPDVGGLETEILKSPHNVPSFMDMRNGRDENDGDEVSSAADISLDLSFNNTPDEDEDCTPVKSYDAHDAHGNVAHPLIQVHEVVEEAEDQLDPDFSPQSPSSPLTEDTVTTGFNLSPPARPQRLGGTGSMISLVDVSV